MTLWPHQARGLCELDRLIQSGSKNICLTSPTGGGKSRMCLTRILENRSAIVYTHRKLLFNQWLSDVFTPAGIDVGLRATGHSTATLKQTQLGMIQSEHSAVIQRKSRDIHRAQEIWIDEAHNNTQQQAQDLIAAHRQANPNCVVIGMTATPLGIGHIYDDLVIAGTNKELRKCGSHIPAYHFGPDEPDLKLIGKQEIGGGECGIERPKRQKFVQRVFGSVVENYHKINPDQKPTLLFAPGVDESVWMARMLTSRGITAAHIDGDKCWVEGETVIKDQDAVDQILDDCRDGKIKVVTNRMVLREGIDRTFFGHLILATVFGSMSSYLQAGGRVIRAHPGLDHVTVTDHGGNWWKFGSLNENREWNMALSDRAATQMRLDSIREGKERHPLHCPECDCIRGAGNACPRCGHVFPHRTRMVMQADGSLKPMKNKTLLPRRKLPTTRDVMDEWRSRVFAIRNSRKPNVRKMTFAQLDVAFAKDHYWKYAPREIPYMPKEPIDWYMRICDVPVESLR